MPERALLVRAFFTLVVARVSTWVLPFRVARKLVKSAPGAPRPEYNHERIRWAIQVSERFVPSATCLPQALTAESLLTRAGHQAQLHLGVRKNARGRIDAHAWVVCEGAIVIGDLPEGLRHYTHLPPLPND
ncbi:MAG TPA: lasso peptide biosynthesis B2 protein [Gemmatimonadaceae bacterium]|nr:lasso peptide biosynthesis B2 protein [Gemmatimonadaceae bacterium]